MLIEGKNGVRELLNGKLTVNKISVQNDVKDIEVINLVKIARNKKIKVEYLPKQALDKKFTKHQGIVAEMVDFNYCETKDILKKAEISGESPLIVILDGIEDPHNFGAIIRTAECMGVHGIIIAKDRNVAVNETVIKVSTGAVANVPVARVVNINNEIDFLKKNGVWVFACETGGEDISKTDLKGSVAIVIGSEGKGIGRLTKEKCDKVITLPMFGKINSLNASVAAGMALYEVKRQNNWGGNKVTKNEK